MGQLFDQSSNLTSPSSNLERDGIYALKENVRKDACALIEYLGGYGLFLVPVGNVEGWLKTLKVNKTKTE